MKHLGRLIFLALIRATTASLAWAQARQAPKELRCLAWNNHCVDFRMMTDRYKYIAASDCDRRLTVETIELAVTNGR